MTTNPLPTNTAAWLSGPGAPLTIGPAPYPTPGPHQIVVRAGAVAVNPVDWMMPLMGRLITPWLHYPAVIGEDVAGEVVEVGEGVTRFRAGDRVAGYALGTERSRNTAAEGAFQAYVVLSDQMAAPVPDNVDDLHAAVLPLAVSTAAVGLFQPDHLGLQLPSAGAEPTGETVMIWGGSTAVGMAAIQLARAAGYEVVTTASPRNADLLHSLGAAEVVDRSADDAVSRLVAALKGHRFVGAFAIGQGSDGPCLKVVAQAGGRAVLTSASSPVSFTHLRAGRGALVRALPTMLQFVRATAALRIRARRLGIQTSAVWGGSIKDNAVGPAIWVDFLPAALAEGRYRLLPEPRVVGTGLEHLPEAFAVQRAGMSAEKIVVAL